jgi:hypothetical protein
VQGGTAVEEKRRWPLVAVLAGVAAAVIIAIVLASGGDKAAPTPSTTPTPQAEAPVEASTPAQPTFTDPNPTAQAPAGPDPAVLAAALQQDLKRQRLWASVSVAGTRVDVRSGSCGDPAMGPILDGAAPGFKAAGLTKLRCLEQSGRVVSDRDL